MALFTENLRSLVNKINSIQINDNFCHENGLSFHQDNNYLFLMLKSFLMNEILVITIYGNDYLSVILGTCEYRLVKNHLGNFENDLYLVNLINDENATKQIEGRQLYFRWVKCRYFEEISSQQQEFCKKYNLQIKINWNLLVENIEKFINDKIDNNKIKENKNDKNKIKHKIKNKIKRKNGRHQNKQKNLLSQFINKRKHNKP